MTRQIALIFRDTASIDAYLFAVDVDHAGVAFRGAVELADALDAESFDELKINFIYVYRYY